MSLAQGNLSSRFPTRSQKMARGLKFQIKKAEGLYYLHVYVVKTKTLISCVVTAQLICTFVFAYEPCREKTDFFAYEKTKTQISLAVTAKLISAFVFAT